MAYLYVLLTSVANLSDVFIKGDNIILMLRPGWKICAHVYSRILNLYVMFDQGSKYICDVLSMVENLYVMFCPSWQSYM